MEYVKMPELLNAEVARALAENLGAVKSAISDEVTTACNGGVDSQCCPKKVKFIIFLSNVAVININASADKR